MSTIKTKQVNELIDLAFENLKANFRTINSRSGWHQFLGSEKIGNIATSQGILLLDYFNVDFDRKQLAIEYLFGSQCHDVHRPEIDGGWNYITNFAAMPSTEATCWALLALFKNHRNDSRVKKGIQWLLNNYKNDTNNLGWGTIKTDDSRVYATCLVLRTLYLYNLSTREEFEKGLNWIIRSQNTDYGWGEKYGAISTIFHTSYVLILLKEINNKNTFNFKNGAKWLYDNMITNSSNNWNRISGQLENIEFEYTVDEKKYHQRISYLHLPTPYALAVLMNTNNSHPLLHSEIKDLLNNNNMGFWGHPHLQGTSNKPIWAIFDVLLLFKTIINHFPDWENLKDINIVNNIEIEATQDDLEKFNQVVKKRNRNLRMFIGICTFNFILASTAVLLSTNSKLKDWLQIFSFWQISAISVYTISIIVEIIGSKYLFNKENFKDGWNWIFIISSKKKFSNFKVETMRNIQRATDS